MARETGLTDRQLIDRVNELYGLASQAQARMHLIERDQPGYRNNEQWRIFERQKIMYLIEASDLMESGQIPWLQDTGVGNITDDYGETTVIVRRIYSSHQAENPHSVSDGRVIQLMVETDGRHRLSLAFTRPETIQEAIDQLQDELADWDEYDGPVNIFREEN